MKLLFEKRFLKDVEAITSATVKHQVESIIFEIEKETQITNVRSVKKMKGHKSAYRIRVGHFRLGLFLENHIVIL
jgi:mRNA interferase RelE/StbE